MGARKTRKPEEHDKPLRMSVHAGPKDGLVHLDFEKAVAQLILPPNAAMQLAALLIRKARECVKPS